ncbi:MAG: UDP-N-acetylmuramoyl-tripeptide--D-alanyl-D-alanine ligase [Nitrospinales bacterium]
MIASNANEIRRAVGGELLFGSGDKYFRGVSIDSRTIRPRELYFCIRGEHYDGHDFISEAVEKKASGVILSNEGKIPKAFHDAGGASDFPFIIRVRDTLTALQDCARFHRKQFQVRVVAITGTNGKSTTKEMAAAIAERKFKTLKTEGNFNNHIGLPLTLFNLDAGHEVAVLEMGMSAAGEIRRLAEIAEPEVGIISNISEGHLVKLRTLKNVQAAKGELFQALNQKGTAIVNADDPLVLDLARSLRSRVVTFAIDNPADIRADDIRPRGNDGYDFNLRLFEREMPVFLPFLGRCNIYNALAAIAAGHSLGVDTEAISRGLENCRLMDQRFQVLRYRSMTIINDTYNANPRSMREALAILSQYQISGRRFFVIGDMLELGDAEQEAHTRLGEETAGSPVDFFVTVGKRAALAGQSALKAGMTANRAVILNNHQEAVDYLSKNARPGDCLLFKGSRGSKMEKVVQGFTASENL